MSTNPPEQPAPAPPVSPAAPAPTEGKAKRYAAYDKTYEKFLPGVHKTKGDAQKAAKALKDKPSTVVGDVEIREV